MGGGLSICHKLPSFLSPVSLHQPFFSSLTPRQPHHSINNFIPRERRICVLLMIVGVEHHLQGRFGVMTRPLSSFRTRERKKWIKPKNFSALLEQKGFIVKGNTMSNLGQKIVSLKWIPGRVLMASTDYGLLFLRQFLIHHPDVLV